jgi:hypothetical protein
VIVIRKLVFLFFFLALYILSNAQKDSSFVDDIYFVPKKNVKDNPHNYVFCVEFNYDSFFVGNEREDEYVRRIKFEKNADKKGKGDKWAINWDLDKKEIFEASFTNGLLDKFNKNMNLGERDKANYIIKVAPRYLNENSGQIDLYITVNLVSGAIPIIYESRVNPQYFVGGNYIAPFDPGKVTSDCYYISGKTLAKKINLALKDVK